MPPGNILAIAAVGAALYMYGLQPIKKASVAVWHKITHVVAHKQSAGPKSGDTEHGDQQKQDQ